MRKINYPENRKEFEKKYTSLIINSAIFKKSKSEIEDLLIKFEIKIKFEDLLIFPIEKLIKIAKIGSEEIKLIGNINIDKEVNDKKMK